MVKKLVLAWDPDFTKLTPEERKTLERAKQTDCVPADEIDWDNLEIDDEPITEHEIEALRDMEEDIKNGGLLPL